MHHAHVTRITPHEAIVALALICTLAVPCVSPCMLLVGIWSLNRASGTGIVKWITVLGTIGHSLWSVIVIYVAVEMARLAVHLPPLSDGLLKN